MSTSPRSKANCTATSRSTRPRPARWWKRRPPAQPDCSFCGRPSPAGGQLVKGPGVAICGACVALAHEILERQHSAA
ncbi:ClpX C4-type zinc finger protein [Phytohabitans sp. LJ34]|uniref:ClpX C4-type zinc finger protein n=1 Tax=Phytohabitans sp. LJ34 TaxID=3452217 RepID=UPI003F8CD0CE